MVIIDTNLPPLSVRGTGESLLTYTSEYFSLNVKVGERATNITMHVFTPVVNTSHIPQTLTILANRLPEILQSTCFNEDNLPFNQEVAHTEIGHLFEHILLEYLCRETQRAGWKQSIFNGITNWDWTTDMQGVFHMNIDIGVDHLFLLSRALPSSIMLMEEILKTYAPSEGRVGKFSRNNFSMGSSKSNYPYLRLDREVEN